LRVGVFYLEAAHSLQKTALESFILGTISGVGMLPFVQVKYSLNAGLKHLLHATEAGLHGGVERASFDRDAEAGGAENGILLGMDTDAEIVAGAGRMRFAAGAAQAASVQAIGHVAGRAIVTGGDDAPVFGNHRADTVAYAI